MRIAVISDVHANLPALDAVLAAIRDAGQPEALWHLGDVVGYGPHPAEVIDRLRAAGALGVMGNHDAAAIGRIGTEWFNDDARTAIEWSAERLGAPHLAWLRGQPESRREMDVTLVHGSPRDPIWEYVYSPPIARSNFGAFDTRLCLVGHTHVPLVFRDRDGHASAESPDDGETIELRSTRAIVNPGSVGQPRDGDPRSAWLLLDTDALTATWHRVPYDVRATQADMRAARLPGRLVDRLELGL